MPTICCAPDRLDRSAEQEAAFTSSRYLLILCGVVVQGMLPAWSTRQALCQMTLHPAANTNLLEAAARMTSQASLADHPRSSTR